jgi:hypothetical protein
LAVHAPIEVPFDASSAGGIELTADEGQEHVNLQARIRLELARCWLVFIAGRRQGDLRRRSLAWEQETPATEKARRALFHGGRQFTPVADPVLVR